MYCINLCSFEFCMFRIRRCSKLLIMLLPYHLIKFTSSFFKYLLLECLFSGLMQNCRLKKACKTNNNTNISTSCLVTHNTSTNHSSVQTKIHCKQEKNSLISCDIGSVVESDSENISEIPK